MKVSQAIEIKSRTGDAFLATDPNDLDEADRLSIEALKQLQGLYNQPFGSPLPPLPGETPEEEP